METLVHVEDWTGSMNLLKGSTARPVPQRKGDQIQVVKNPSRVIAGMFKDGDLGVTPLVHVLREIVGVDSCCVATLPTIATLPLRR